ncbi:THAP domain-containing protein 5-like [Spinachia spinachia]
MPRYCAVKVCRNRGGTSSRQDNKRISFYPFPLQDKPRLQKWVCNMRREEWTPSRHQYLCSEHFTEDCFDVRWGIRYLKNTAIPTLFLCAEDDAEEKVTRTKRSPKAKPLTFDIDSPLSKRPLVFSGLCKNVQPCTTAAEMAFELPPVSGICGPSDLSEIPCDLAGDSGRPTMSYLALSTCSDPHLQEQAHPIVTVWCCESPGLLSDGEENAQASALDQTYSFVPVQMVKSEQAACFSGQTGPCERDHISLCEHSYCRSDTDKEELWRKILSLHAKILELDHREESTLTKIHALETEVALLKRDGVVFEEKQKILGNYLSSMLIV